MARPASHTFQLSDGRVVGYGLTNRSGPYRVRFTGPDGRRWEESTGFEDKNKAIVRAAQIILKAFHPTPTADPKKATWETALKELRATPNLRPDTLRNYKTTINVFRQTIPDTTGPGEVTTDHATRFKRLYMGTPGRQGKPRSPNSCRTWMRSLRSLWNQHFKELGYVVGNPWEEVEYPDGTRKTVRIPDADHFDTFLTWLSARYPDWPLIHLFVRVKGLLGCRTWDVCQLLASDLRPGKLFIRPEIDKTKTGRLVPLPADVFTELSKLAEGQTWLWGRYTEDARVHRWGTRNKAHFDPQTLKWAIGNIFREYNKAHPDKVVKPHDLRRRAITLTVLATKDVDGTGHALGVTPQTARRYYVDASKAHDTDELLSRMAGVLDLKPVTKPAE